jgi:hypothetical protein
MADNELVTRLEQLERELPMRDRAACLPLLGLLERLKAQAWVQILGDDFWRNCFGPVGLGSVTHYPRPISLNYRNIIASTVPATTRTLKTSSASKSERISLMAVSPLHMKDSADMAFRKAGLPLELNCFRTNRKKWIDGYA